MAEAVNVKLISNTPSFNHFSIQSDPYLLFYRKIWYFYSMLRKTGGNVYVSDWLSTLESKNKTGESGGSWFRFCSFLKVLISMFKQRNKVCVMMCVCECMCLHVCMRVCMCVVECVYDCVCGCVRVYVCGCMCVHMCVYLCLCMYTCLRVCVCMHMYICMYVHVCVCVCARLCVFVCV